MAGEHYDSGILRRFVAEELSAAETLRIAKHLALCDDCGAVALQVEDAWRRQMPDAERTHDLDPYDSAFLDAFELAIAERSRIEAERELAPELYRELLRLSPSRQRMMVKNSSRYRNWGLVELLLATCRETWREDPTHSLHLAGLASELAARLEVSASRRRLLEDLKAEVYGAMANCHRILCHHQEARESFTRGYDCLSRGTEDPIERARLLDLEASFRMSVRDFEGASSLLHEVVSVYRLAGERHLEGRALISLSKLLSDELGDLQESVALLQRAAELIDVPREPMLGVCLQHNLTVSTLFLGHPEEAARLLGEVERLVWAHGSRLDVFRLRWLEGQVKSALAEVVDEDDALELDDRAERALREARDGFVTANIPQDAALVSLDLAIHFLERGRLAEVRQLVGEMLPIFESLDLQRDVLAALAIFRQAAETEVATVKLVKQLSGWIKRSS